MATWTDKTNVFDFVRGPQMEGAKIAYMAVEIEVAATLRVFTTTQLDNYKTAGVLASTGGTADVDMGSDGNPVFGFLEDISEDGATGMWLVVGMTNEVFYAAAAEDPDVSNSVQSKGDGSVKQTPTAATVAAGGQTDGRGIVITKTTTGTTCKIWFP